MPAQCEVKVVVRLTGLEQDMSIARRFTTANIPTATQYGYGTIAAADTMEAINMGQVANSLVDTIMIKSIDNTVYVSPTTLVSTGALLKIEPGESALFSPYNGAAVLSVGIICSTAEAKYAYLAVGRSS